MEGEYKPGGCGSVQDVIEEFPSAKESFIGGELTIETPSARYHSLEAPVLPRDLPVW